MDKTESVNYYRYISMDVVDKENNEWKIVIYNKGSFTILLLNGDLRCTNIVTPEQLRKDYRFVTYKTIRSFTPITFI